MTTSNRNGNIESADPHWVEWLTGGICALLVLAMLGWIGWDMLRYTDDDATFDVTVTSVAPTAGRYRVTFDILNTSMSTASQVHVRGDIRKDGGVTESSDVTFDYVASESRDVGTLFFMTDPAAATLDLQVVGYTDP